MRITKNLPKEFVLDLGKDCKKCGKCCNYGSGYLIDEDITRIAKHLDIPRDLFIKRFLEPVTKFNTTLHRFKLQKLNSKYYGNCIFYNDKKACTIQEVKPLHCRVANCNEYGEDLNLWFNLNFFVNPEDDTSVREYAFYLKQGGRTMPGASLKELVPDKKRLDHILIVAGLNQTNGGNKNVKDNRN